MWRTFVVCLATLMVLSGCAYTPQDLPVEVTSGTLTTNSNDAVADGSHAVLLTYQLALGRALSAQNYHVEFVVTGVTQYALSSSDVMTDANGTAATSLTATSNGNALVSAYLYLDANNARRLLSDSRTVTFSAPTNVSSTPRPGTGVPVSVEFVSQPGSVQTAGTAFTADVAVRDVYGSLVPTSTGIVLAWANAAGVQTALQTFQTSSGIAQCTVSITTAGKAYNLVAALSSGTASAISTAFDVDAAAATMLQFAQQPTGIIAGQIMTPLVVVNAVDSYGNVASASATVTLNAVASGAATEVAAHAAMSNGIATFTYTLTGADPSVIVTASAASLTSALSNRFAVQAASADATASRFSVEPNLILADGVSQSTLQVAVYDTYGNPVAGKAVSFTAIGTANTVSPSGNLTDANGHLTAIFTTTHGEAKTVQASIDAFTKTAAAAAVPVVSQAYSKLTLSSGNVVADGNTAANLILTVRGYDNTPLANQNVVINEVGAGIKVAPSSGKSDTAGVFTASVTSTLAVNSTLDANVGVPSLVRTFQSNVTFVVGGVCSADIMLPSLPLLTAATGLNSVVVYDFDHNGAPDVAVANGNSKTISIFSGTSASNGVFSAPSILTTPDSVFQLTQGDFNGDGNADLAFLSVSTATIYVFYGTTAGTFSTANMVALPADAGTLAIATGDFNGDGATDIASTSPTSQLIEVYLQKAGGGFFAPIASSLGGVKGTALAAIHLTSDANADLVIAGQGNQLYFINHAGGGSFSMGGSFTLAGHPVALATADVNGDGYVDVAAAFASGVQVYLSSGSGAFTTSVSYPTTGTTSTLSIADMSNDGRQDIVTGDVNGLLSVFVGNGTGTFQPAVSYPTNANVAALALADINNDGKADVVMVNSNPSGSTAPVVLPILGNGDGTLRVAQQYNVMASPSALALADFNKDGHQDIAVAGSGNLSVLFGKADGTFASPSPSLSTPTTVGFALAVAKGDFDGDGNQDVVIYDGVGSSVVVLRGKGDGSFYPAVAAATGVNTGSIIAADFNADGNSDIAFTASGKVNILLATTGGNFASAVSYTTGPGSTGLVAAYLDTGTTLDLAVANSTSGTVSILLNSGAGVFAPANAFACGTAPYAIDASDLNGDQVTDLAVAGGGNVTVLAGRGGGLFASPVTYPKPFSAQVLLTRDLNGDGNSEIILGYTDTQAFGVGVMLNASGSFTAPVNYPSGSGPLGVASADFNGDGRLDLAVVNRINATVSVLISSGCVP